MARVPCPECGREIPDTAILCPACGRPVRGRLQPASAGRRFKLPSVEFLGRAALIGSTVALLAASGAFLFYMFHFGGR